MCHAILRELYLGVWLGSGFNHGKMSWMKLWWWRVARVMLGMKPRGERF